ncbi:MAG TPA: magnesium transporter CorA family protein, partial [Thermomicrobiales bacterium]|nr:magnesium transporter CorA family protein [Thermomicrobiales bacterium]
GEARMARDSVTARRPRGRPWTGRERRPAAPAPPAAAGTVGVLEYGGVRWINVERPTADAVAYLREHFHFHELDLEDVLDTLQLPKLDEYADYLFLVVQFPVHSKLTRVTTSTEVDIFAGRDYVITLHDARLKPLVRLFDEAERSAERRADLLGAGAGLLLYRILEQLIDYGFPIARRILQHIEAIDAMIFEPNALRTVQEIATVRRDVIACRRIIKPQVAVLGQLEQATPRVFGRDPDDELRHYFGDLADRIGKLWDILEDAREVVEALSSTADSLTSHRLNQVIKILTIFSVVMLPLTLISSIYGMNVPLPYEQHPLSFALLLVSMAAIAATMVAFFRWRRWL